MINPALSSPSQRKRSRSRPGVRRSACALPTSGRKSCSAGVTPVHAEFHGQDRRGCLDRLDSTPWLDQNQRRAELGPHLSGTRTTCGEPASRPAASAYAARAFWMPRHSERRLTLRWRGARIRVWHTPACCAGVRFPGRLAPSELPASRIPTASSPPRRRCGRYPSSKAALQRTARSLCSRHSPSPTRWRL